MNRHIIPIECSNCGLRSGPQALFCRRCGERVQLACTDCGALQPADSSFCDVCGGALPKPGQPVANRSRSRDTLVPKDNGSTIFQRIDQALNRPGVALRALWLVIAIGLAARLAVVLATNAMLPDSPNRLSGDEPAYDRLAQQFLAGQAIDWPGRTPLYPLFLAASYRLFGHSVASAILVQAFVSLTVIPLTYWVSRRFTRPSFAVMAAAIVALQPALILQSKQLYSEVLFTPLLLLAVGAIIRALQTTGWRGLVIAGVTLGLATLCRPTAFFPMMVLPLLVPTTTPFLLRLRSTTIYLLASIVVIAPWTWYAWNIFGAFIPFGTASGLVLWLGSPEYYYFWANQGLSQLDVWSTIINPARTIDPWSITGSAQFQQRAIASITAEPIAYLWYSLLKAAFLWVGHPAASWEWPFDLKTLTSFYPSWQVWLIVASRVSLATGIAIIIAGHRRLAGAMPLVVVVLGFTIFHAFTYAEARYGEPIYPVVAVLVVIAITNQFPRGSRQPAAEGANSPNQAEEPIISLTPPAAPAVGAGSVQSDLSAARE